MNLTKKRSITEITRENNRVRERDRRKKQKIKLEQYDHLIGQIQKLQLENKQLKDNLLVKDKENQFHSNKLFELETILKSKDILLQQLNGSLKDQQTIILGSKIYYLLYQKTKQQLLSTKTEMINWMEKTSQANYLIEKLKKEKQDQVIFKSKSLSETVLMNTQILLKDLPKHSPIRRGLIYYFTQNLSLQDATFIYGYGTSFYSKVNKDRGRFIVNLKYPPKVTRSKLAKKKIPMIQEILNQPNVLPILSGRSYRVQTQSNYQIYLNYKQHDSNPVSFSFFKTKILDKERIWHSLRPNFCPICSGEEFELLKNGQLNHEDCKRFQLQTYLKQKREIASGEKSKHTLVVMDFYQLHYEGGFSQVLVFSKYEHNHNISDGLNRTYVHFVGQTNDTNDINFVVGCTTTLFKENWFGQAEKICFWTDGGPKHFKISSNMRFFSSLQDKYRSKYEIEYNYFPSYHGSGICDAVGSQANRKVSQKMRDSSQAIRDIYSAIQAIGELNNHTARLAVLADNNFSCNTMNGIRSYHKFCFPKQGQIKAYVSSNKETIDKNYLPRDMVLFDEIEINN
jgi:hypothetical protein